MSSAQCRLRLSASTMPRARASFRISRGSFRALMRQLRTESPSAAVSVAGKRLFRQQRRMRAKPPTGSDNRLQRPSPFAQSRHVAVIHGQLGKSPFDRECVVGLEGLELRANHAVAIERVSGRNKSASELPKNLPERTGNQSQKERYYWKFRAPRGALRSCPAGLIAEVGLRWWGARPSSI